MIFQKHPLITKSIDLYAFLFYNTSMEIKKKMEQLSRELLHHQYLYYVNAEPEITDSEYDALFDQLVELETQNPELASENSPTKRVGSDLDNSFPEKEHTIPVLSLDKEYHVEGLEKWLTKTVKNAGVELSFVVEEKIDGASIVLYYKAGKLESALTRGNGLVGNDVTENIRTIPQVPLTINETGDLAVRGEIFINKSEFGTYNKNFENKYANPRNLAAGSLRNIKSSVVAKVPLKIFTYEGFFSSSPTNDHILTLSTLKELGFPINNNLGYFCDNKEKRKMVHDKLPQIKTGTIAELATYVEEQMKLRDSLDHEIDGLVIKVNQLDVREQLGYTAHHPRWALAFKFDAPTAETKLLEVQIQIGRNGRATPVGILEPVKIAGSTVSRATLHNQEYIDMLELGPGDHVAISKRGDIIPAVEKVLEKNPDHPSTFKFPETCPFCETQLVKEGAHHFCKNRQCEERQKRSIIYFAAKNQMDIDTLGEKTINLLFEKGYVKDIPGLYSFNYDELLKEEGFKEKKIANIKQSVEKSKTRPFRKVLTSLGFDALGNAAVKELIANGFDSIDKIIEGAQKKDVQLFSAIEGFADIMAQQIINHFTDKENLELIKRLKKVGLNFAEEPAPAEGSETASAQTFKDQVWVITGTFEHFQPRSKAAEEIEKRGGKVTGSVSSKTTHLLAGESAGSKLTKAEKLGIPVVKESDFLGMLA